MLRPVRLLPCLPLPRECPRSTRTLRTQAKEARQQYHDQDTRRSVPGLGMATPRDLVEYLDQYVIGQENAKKALSVAVYNHYNRVRANLDQSFTTLRDLPPHGDVQGVSSANLRPLRRSPPSFSLNTRTQPLIFDKSNVLVIGPTGSGKTLLVRTLARILDVPFSVSDATSFTQAGYVGEDVDMAIQRLLQAADWDPIRASTGIVYIDEIDKIARKSSSGSEGSRDVGGEGVQQALLRMMEGSVITVQGRGGAAPLDSPPAPGSLGNEAPPRNGQRAPPQLATPKSEATYHIDTSNVLFILSGAFVGLDKVIRQRTAKGSIGFTANLASVDNSLGFFTPNNKSRNPLDGVETTDLVQYGFIPEFISRLPSITSLAPLTIPDLRRILTDVKGSLVQQYRALFEYSGVELRFTSEALDEICKKAYERGGGARGLRGIMETILLDPMYEVPGSEVRFVLITGDVVREKALAQYWKKGHGAHFWEAWATAETAYSKSLS